MWFLGLVLLILGLIMMLRRNQTAKPKKERNWLSLDLLMLKKDLTAEELALVKMELERLKKSPLVMWLLWLFTGQLGGHRYYLGDRGRAILHTIVGLLAVGLTLLWSVYVLKTATAPEDIALSLPMGNLFLGIPSLWAIIDAFFIGRQLARKNAELEMDIINKIKNIRSDATTAP